MTTSVTFPSIVDFQNHYRASDELVMPENSALVIQNASFFKELHAKKQCCETSGKINQSVQDLLSSLIHPLGKSLKVQNETTLDYKMESEEEFVIRFSTVTKLQASKGEIRTYFYDLVKLMILSNIKQVNFQPHQKITILNISDDEYSLSIKQDTLLSICLKRVPKNTDVDFQFNGSSSCNASIGCDTTTKQKIFSFSFDRVWMFITSPHA